MVWIITVYRDFGHTGENYTKTFQQYEDAFDYFRAQIVREFENEIEMGLISNQELENVVSSGIYTFDSENYEVVITLEAGDEVHLDEIEEDQDYYEEEDDEYYV